MNMFGCDSVGADGLNVTGSFGPVSFEASSFTIGTFPVGSLNAAYWIMMGRASMQLMPGWTFGVNVMSERCNQNCGTPLTSNGWGVDVSGTIIPGVTLTAEYATFTPDALLGSFTNTTAYQVNTV